MAARLGACRIALCDRIENTAGAELSSRWIQSPGELHIAVACAGIEGHDVALELLVCLAQALWETCGPAEKEAYWKHLASEIEAGVSGEIDEEALREKRRLLASRAAARSGRRFERYARASFAGTAAEYVHCLWHEVQAREGPEHLPAPWLRRRLQMLARWFPPDPGQLLFPPRAGASIRSSGGQF